MNLPDSEKSKSSALIIPFPKLWWCLHAYCIPTVRTSGESNRPLTPIHVKKYRDAPPISIAYFCKSMPSSWQKVVYTPPIYITIRLPFVSRYFCRSIRVRGRWDTPKNRDVCPKYTHLRLRVAPYCTLPRDYLSYSPISRAVQFGVNMKRLGGRYSLVACALEVLYTCRTWWTFRIFFIFSARGGGRGSPSPPGGVDCLLKIPDGGEVFLQGRGAGRVSAANWGFCWGGGNILFGAEMSTKRRGVSHEACHTALQYYLEKVLHDLGGISHWAAKPPTAKRQLTLPSEFTPFQCSH